MSSGLPLRLSELAIFVLSWGRNSMSLLPMPHCARRKALVGQLDQPNGWSIWKRAPGLTSFPRRGGRSLREFRGFRTCHGNSNTKLPDGSTVGDHVNAVSNKINNSTQFAPSPYGPTMQIGNGVVTNVYRGTNFRKMYGGAGANYPFLGDAGNFAYFAVSGNIGVPLSAAEAAAGAYAYATHSAADRVGPYGMDQSATSQVSGYGACKKK
jgi:hypothetical protein